MPTVNSVDAANFPNCNRLFGVFSMCANENKDRQKDRTRKKGTSVFFGHFPPLRLSAAAADADAVLLTTSAWCFYCLYCARSFCQFFSSSVSVAFACPSPELIHCTREDAFCMSWQWQCTVLSHKRYDTVTETHYLSSAVMATSFGHWQFDAFSLSLSLPPRSFSLQWRALSIARH